MEKKRINSLQVVRAFAFLEIFCCHCLWGSGALGVSIFFILSGFLLTYNHIGEIESKKIVCSLKDCICFGIKKVKKLYPLHIAMMFVMVVVTFFLWHNNNYTEWKALLIQVFLHSLLLQTWVPKIAFYFSLNGVSWYLATCFFTYVLFPMILKVIENYRKRKNAIVCICGIYVIQFVVAFFFANILKVSDSNIYYITYICPLYRIGDFIIGCNLGYLFQTRSYKKVTSKARYTVLEVIVILWILLSESFFGKSGLCPEWIKYCLLFTPVAIFTIYVFAVGKGRISKVLENNVLITFIAKISPFAFLIHYEVIQGIKTFLGISIWNKYRFVVALISMIVTIVFSWIYIKGDIVRRKKCRIGQR